MKRLGSVLLLCGVLAWLPWGAQAQTTEARVTGVVWLDKNADGLRQADEPMVANALVALSFQGSRGTPVVLADGDGSFRFTWAGGVPLAPEAPHYSVRLETGFCVETILSRNPAFPLFCAGGDPWPSYSGCTLIGWVFPGQSYVANVTLVPSELRNRLTGAPPQDWPVPGGHFFKDTWDSRTNCDTGFMLDNSNGIPFLNIWRDRRGEALGRPTSHRFTWEGRVTQVFGHRFAMQWIPDRGSVVIQDPTTVRNLPFPLEIRARAPLPPPGPAEPWVHILGPSPVYGPDDEQI